MKYIGYICLIFVMGMVVLAGCTPVPNAAPQQTVSEAESGKTPIQSPAAVSYTIANSSILRHSEDGKETIYDAAPYYDPEWMVWVGNLAQDGQALYFAEGAVFSDGVSCICETEELGASYAVVKTDLDGGNRLVLTKKTQPSGYWDVAVYGDHVFYVDGTDDAVTVGYIGKDGSGGGVLDLAAAAGGSAVCTNALLDVEDGYLTITADFSDAETVKTLNLRVDEALEITVDLAG